MINPKFRIFENRNIINAYLLKGGNIKMCISENDESLFIKHRLRSFSKIHVFRFLFLLKKDFLIFWKTYWGFFSFSKMSIFFYFFLKMRIWAFFLFKNTRSKFYLKSTPTIYIVESSYLQAIMRICAPLAIKGKKSPATKTFFNHSTFFSHFISFF